MTPFVFALVLSAALIHALWNAVVKGASDRTITFGLVMAGHTLPALMAVPFLPLPDPAAAPYLIASVFIHWGYYYLLVSAYRFGDLSLAYPIARGATPMLVALSALIFLNEGLSPQGWFGLTLVSMGILALAVFSPRKGNTALAVIFALATAMMIATYSLVDGVGVRTSTNPFSYIAWLFILEGVVVFLIIIPRMDRLRQYNRKQIVTGLTGGVLAGLAYGLVLFAKTMAPLGMVSALRETSVIFASMIGLFWFGEGPARTRLTAAVIVTAGIVLLSTA
ncbi:MAG: EamA family transporter [Candidatus Puniceispirillales bacterium]